MFAICDQFWRRTPLTSEPLSQDKDYLEVQTCFDVPIVEKQVVDVTLLDIILTSP